MSGDVRINILIPLSNVVTLEVVQFKQKFKNIRFGQSGERSRN